MDHFWHTFVCNLYSYMDHFWHTFVCNLFHGGFCYFFSRGLRRMAGGFQCGHL